MLKKKLFETTAHYILKNAAASAAISVASVIASELITYGINKIKAKSTKIEETSKILKNDDGIFYVESAE